jgi:tetratricopeptide (TPR) repeat protein
VDLTEVMRSGIDAVRKDEYLLGLTLLGQAYSGSGERPAPDGLSYYGLCIALVQKKFKPAVDLCKKAIELQFYHGEHYANLARVYLAAEHRKKAISTVHKGLKVVPEDENLIRLRRELGVRRPPPIPFLSRSNPLNVALGRSRHARELAAKEEKKKKASEAKKTGGGTPAAPAS